MDILSKNGGSPDRDISDNDIRLDEGGSPDSTKPLATPTSVIPVPFASSEPGGAHGRVTEILFGEFLLRWPITSRNLPSLDGNRGNVPLSWTVNNNNDDQINITSIEWVARSAMISNEADQVIVDKMIIDRNISAVNSKRGFLSDDAHGEKGIAIDYGRWLRTLQDGKDPGELQEGLGPSAGRRLVSESDFMRLKISWTKRRDGKKGISNSGVFFVKTPVGLVPDPSWANNMTGYEEDNVGTSVDVATSTTQIGSLPTSSDASESNGQATQAAGSSSNSLSTGAVAGIAVGSAIAVVLVAGLAWFLLRRRRNQREFTFEPQHKVTSSMADKALAVAQTVNSDRSGRSEDSGRQDYTTHSTNTNNPAATAYGGQHEQCPSSENHTGSFANLHDTPATIAAARGMQEHEHGADSDAGREEPPHAHITLPIPPRIRHLVEPHHTDDDLRRLLAEEDLLDEEIARAS